MGITFTSSNKLSTNQAWFPNNTCISKKTFVIYNPFFSKHLLYNVSIYDVDFVERFVYTYIREASFNFKYSNICIFSDLAKFDLDGLQLDMKKMDYRVALQMTHNIMILEIIHRVVVCIFEVRMS